MHQEQIDEEDLRKELTEPGYYTIMKQLKLL
jgi:hypothetical protein